MNRNSEDAARSSRMLTRQEYAQHAADLIEVEKNKDKCVNYDLSAKLRILFPNSDPQMITDAIVIEVCSKIWGYKVDYVHQFGYEIAALSNAIEEKVDEAIEKKESPKKRQRKYKINETANDKVTYVFEEKDLKISKEATTQEDLRQPKIKNAIEKLKDFFEKHRQMSKSSKLIMPKKFALSNDNEVISIFSEKNEHKIMDYKGVEIVGSRKDFPCFSFIVEATFGQLMFDHNFNRFMDPNFRLNNFEYQPPELMRGNYNDNLDTFDTSFDVSPGDFLENTTGISEHLLSITQESHADTLNPESTILDPNNLTLEQQNSILNPQDSTLNPGDPNGLNDTVPDVPDGQIVNFPLPTDIPPRDEDASSRISVTMTCLKKATNGELDNIQMNEIVDADKVRQSICESINLKINFLQLAPEKVAENHLFSLEAKDSEMKETIQAYKKRLADEKKAKANAVEAPVKKLKPVAMDDGDFSPSMVIRMDDCFFGFTKDQMKESKTDYEREKRPSYIIDVTEPEPEPLPIETQSENPDLMLDPSAAGKQKGVVRQSVDSGFDSSTEVPKKKAPKPQNDKEDDKFFEDPNFTETDADLNKIQDLQTMVNDVQEFHNKIGPYLKTTEDRDNIKYCKNMIEAVDRENGTAPLSNIINKGETAYGFLCSLMMVNQGNFKITHAHDAEGTKDLKDIKIELVNKQLNIEQLQKSFGVPTEKDKPTANNSKRRLSIIEEDEEEDEDDSFTQQQISKKPKSTSSKRKGPLQTSTPNAKKTKPIPSTPFSENSSPYQNSNITFSTSILGKSTSTNNSQNTLVCSQESGYDSSQECSPTKSSPSKSMYSNESGYSSLPPSLCGSAISVPSSSKNILGTRVMNLPRGSFVVPVVMPQTAR